MRCLNVPTPRGTAGRLPWTTNVDMNVAWAPSFVEGLQFKMDVFNLFNSRKVTSVSEIAEDAATGDSLPKRTCCRRRSRRRVRSASWCSTTSKHLRLIQAT